MDTSRLEQWEIDAIKEAGARAQQQEQARKASTDEYLRKQKEVGDRIVAMLNGLGASDVETNNYWFQGKIAGFCFSFVNQETRICGEAYIPPSDSALMEIMKDRYSRNGGITIKLRDKYRYWEFILNGDPVSKATEMINRLLETR